MPDNPADLHLVGLTTDGHLWHTMRQGANGHWLLFEDSTIAEAGKPGDFIDVDCARQVANADQHPSALHVVGVTADGRLWWASRNSQTGSWNPFQNVEGSGGGEAGTFVRAAVSVSHAWQETPHGQPTVEIHLAGLTSDGRLLVTSQARNAATFSRFTNVELTGGREQGDLRAAALAGITGRNNATSSHLCAITGDGHLLHSIGRPGSWQDLRDVESVGHAGEGGDLVDVGCADDLHVGAVSGDGHVWYTSRDPSHPERWLTFRDLESARNVGTFTRISAAQIRSGLHFSGVTSDGQLWHTIRKDPTLPFGDVEDGPGHAGEIGTFQTVGVA
jgi:hypothetical protein